MRDFASHRGLLTNPRFRCAALYFYSTVALLIVSGAAVASESRDADAVHIFHCTFSEDWDVNYDHWPDRWIRKTGLDYPHYVGIEIHNDATARGGKCLRIDLDGAAAAISSPPIRVMSRFSYVFEAQLKNEGLTHSEVVATLDFCNSAGKVLQTKRSKPFSTTKGWQQVQLGPIEPTDPTTDRVVFGLQVTRGNKGDLHGRVSLADVWLARLPRIVVSADQACNVYDRLDDVVVRCELSGIRERDPEIRFQLLDVFGHEVQSGNFRLDGRKIIDNAKQASDVTDGLGKGLAGYEGSTEWRPKIPDYGFYRVVVRMLSSESAHDTSDAEREMDSRTVWLAVVPPLSMPRQGEFGWTLPHGDGPLNFQELSRVLPQCGVNWVKLPVWFNADDPRRADDVIRFVELLGASNIEVVAIVDRPPAKSELGVRIGRDASIADLLSLDPSAWMPSLEPVMTRLSLRVRWWQLGRDNDTSFIGFPDLTKRISDLRTAMFRFGQDVRMGLSCDWANAAQHTGEVTWDFQQLRSETPLFGPQIEELLAQPRQNSALRWVLIEPPSRPADASDFTKEALDIRYTEFVQQLVAAKVHGADAIIVPNPFSDENGLMRSGGMPGELLLPWRTTVAMLGGASYLGQLQLPGGSENRIFLRQNGQVVMVIWNSQPTEEVLYLGEDIRHVDICGRTTIPELKDREQIIPVGTVPTFVIGLHEAIARWRMAVSFENQSVPSIFATPHRNALRFRNFFPQGVGGSLKITVPQDKHAGDDLVSHDALPSSTAFVLDRWTIEPPQGAFQMAVGENAEFPFDIRLKNAFFGKQPVRVEFTVDAEEQYKFSVYHDLEVGTDDLTLDVKSHLDEDGTLIVEQWMTNTADRLADFRCYLYAKGHRRQRMQVYRLGPNMDRKVYRFADGAGLVGNEMLLELEELNGPRVVKYRFVATGESDDTKPTTENESGKLPATTNDTESVKATAAVSPS